MKWVWRVVLFLALCMLAYFCASCASPELRAENTKLREQIAYQKGFMDGLCAAQRHGVQ